MKKNQKRTDIKNQQTIQQTNFYIKNNKFQYQKSIKSKQILKQQIDFDLSLFSKIRQLKKRQQIQTIEDQKLSKLIKKQGSLKSSLAKMLGRSFSNSSNQKFSYYKEYNKQVQMYSEMYVGLQRWNKKQEDKQKKNHFQIQRIKKQKKKNLIQQISQKSLRNIKESFQLNQKLGNLTHRSNKWQNSIKNHLIMTKYNKQNCLTYKEDYNLFEKKARLTSYVRKMQAFQFFMRKNNKNSMKSFKNNIKERVQQRMKKFQQVQNNEDDTINKFYQELSQKQRQKQHKNKNRQEKSSLIPKNFMIRVYQNNSQRFIKPLAFS